MEEDGSIDSQSPAWNDFELLERDEAVSKEFQAF